MPTNPRTDRDTRKAIKLLKELTEFQELGAGGADVQEALGDMIEDGEAFLVENAEDLETLVHARLTQLTGWRPEVVGGPLEQPTDGLRKQAMTVVGFLRGRGW